MKKSNTKDLLTVDKETSRAGKNKAFPHGSPNPRKASICNRPLKAQPIPPIPHIEEEQPPRIFDEDGEDVTPLPMCKGGQMRNTPRKRRASLLGNKPLKSYLSKSPGLKQSSLKKKPKSGTPRQSQCRGRSSRSNSDPYLIFAGPGPFPSSVFNVSSSYCQTSRARTRSVSIIGDLESLSGNENGLLALPDKDQEDVVPSDEDLDEVVEISLDSSNLLWFIDIAPIHVVEDSAEGEAVKIANTHYKDCLENIDDDDIEDKFASQEMMTFNDIMKTKELQTDKILKKDVETNVSDWDIYNTYEGEEIPKEEKAAEPERHFGSDDEEKNFSYEYRIRYSSINYMGKSESFMRNLNLMERAVSMNKSQSQLAIYHGRRPDINPVPTLTRLWSYSSKKTEGHNISCMDWNKHSKNILAVGYGQTAFDGQKGGLICGWNIKNSSYPERIYTCKSGVTSLAFSTHYPQLLAAGFYDGTISIYNVANKELTESVADSVSGRSKKENSRNRRESSPNIRERHTGPVWQLKWVVKALTGDSRRGKEEVLISVGGDGVISHWSIDRGLKNLDLMRLRRKTHELNPEKIAKQKRSKLYISRYIGGFCIDFHPTEPRLYIVGTDDGWVHRCVWSRRRNYTKSYRHRAPVYAVQWSPFVPDAFLSSGGDWNVFLWHQDYDHPVKSFQSPRRSKPVCAWSPWSSTVFACIHEEAVEVWDLSISTMEAVARWIGDSWGAKKLTSMKFCPISRNLVVGDDDGTVFTLAVQGLPQINKNEDDGLKKIIDSFLAAKMSAK